eukprot:Unigene9050_Nuclearia_a/m.27684 Unigene9050_Nuclearia_a/g.27684  ORF Unigene9050_Nuclearia_a/g.27684 Unigene9050_Nuclearia_a/m.27684 type:complete len:559 (+) Unigene9050_Nuclearia_a:945-2621(+)
MQALVSTFTARLCEIDAIPVRHDQNDLRRRRIVSVVLHHRLGVFTGEGGDLQDLAWKRWLLFRRHVERLSAVFTATMPDLARLVRSYVEGQFSKRLGFASRHQGQQYTSNARGIIRDVIDTYAGHVLAALQAVTAPPSNSAVPVDPLQAAFIVSRAHYNVVQCWDMVRMVKVAHGDDAGAFGKLRSALVGVICDAWVSETRRFAEYEHWTADTQHGSQTTSLPRLFREFSRLLLLSLRDIAAFQHTHTSDAHSAAPPPPQPMRIVAALRDRIRATTFEALSSFADVLHHLAFAPADALDLSLVTARTRRLGQTLVANVDDPSTRVLVVLSNVVYIRDVMLPALRAEFEAFFQASMSHAAETALATLGHLESLLYQRYLATKMSGLSQLVEQGMLWSGVNWLQTQRPNEIRSYAYEVLMRLVKVHHQVTDTSRTILARVMGDVLGLLAVCYADAVAQIGTFGLGGMMQVLLELEFIQQTLAAYETPDSRGNFAGAVTILRALTRLQPAVGAAAKGGSSELGPTEAKDPPALQAELKELREVLRQAARFSEAQFRCFARA